MASKTPLIGQRIALGFAIALAASLAIGILSLRNLNEMQRESEWVSHTIEVQSEVSLLNDSVSHMESVGQAYLISGEETLRAQIAVHRAHADASLKKLQSLTIDNASQQARLEKLGSLLNLQTSAAQQVASMRGSGDAGSARRVSAMVIEGQAIAQNFRTVSDSIADEETRLLVLRHEASRRATSLTRNTVVYGSLAALILVTVSGFFLTRSVTVPLANLRTSAARIGSGNYAHRATISSDDEVGHLGTVFNEMAAQVERRQAILADQDWLKTALSTFSLAFQRQRDPTAIGTMVLGDLAVLLDIRHSVLYRYVDDDGGPAFRLCASYAADNPPSRLGIGESLVGQCGVERRRIILANIPEDYVRIGSALGGSRPGSIVLQPVEFENRIKAVMELASLKPLTDLQLELVERLAASLGIVFQNLEATAQTEDLLRKSQALTAQLEAQRRILEDQQVELTQTNEELEQTNEEMEQANEELEEKTNLLADQKRELENSNRVIEEARAELQEQARQLMMSSTYKSNFLATMSHELRTPLNSLLILARLLAENGDGNLTTKQVQFARTIESSGGDLLEMINQILDLAKIESGTAELKLDEVSLTDLQRSVDDQFRHVADSKHLGFTLNLDAQLPERIRTDVGRLHQVIKNLLANAFKFTERGSVRVDFRVASDGWSRSSASLNAARRVIAISVTDTGIGIPKDKQEIIFESFQQADAGTARRFGGTGLGLSISREIATMLGGVLQLESDTGKGSTFTLFIPAVLEQRTKPEPTASQKNAAAILANGPQEVSDERAAEPPEIDEAEMPDDRANIQPGDRVLLIIEDDLNFAGILADLAREKRFKALVARGARRALALAQRFSPAAITLDIRLVDEDGWLVLDRLKHDPRTRHIPVHVISVDAARSRGLRQGAVSFLQKPVTREAIEDIFQQTIDFIERRVRNLLVVEDDAVQRKAIQELIGNGDVHTTAVGTAAEALSALAEASYDCIVMDLVLPDRSGAELIREINRRLGLHAPPVIVYTGKDLSPREEMELRSLSESIIVKDARSPERLLDETALFLHRVQARLPEAKRRMLEQVRRQDAVLTGRRVLIVDDDARNIFALTAVLEGCGMNVQFAESGPAALKTLNGNTPYDVVLMDIMMPEMDGNEVIRRLRSDGRFAKLPIIAVTAKAMKGDRERTIESGASDYITKPVDTEKLVSLLRVWLYR